MCAVLAKLHELSQSVIQKTLHNGGIAIDATAGNGHDTLFLAQCITHKPAELCKPPSRLAPSPPSSSTTPQTHNHVYSFDVQEQAITKSKQLLAQHNLLDTVSFYQLGHEKAHTILPAHLFPFADTTLEQVNFSQVMDFSASACTGIAAITFNLGYLPGSSKEIVTQSANTLAALCLLLPCLKVGGIISIHSYLGHKGGTEEAQDVEQFLTTLCHKQWFVFTYTSPNKPNNPEILHLIERRL